MKIKKIKSNDINGVGEQPGTGAVKKKSVNAKKISAKKDKSPKTAEFIPEVEPDKNWKELAKVG